ncbi:MAG TPA: hypothetical protein VF518_11735 [Polyangia bacterium]
MAINEGLLEIREYNEIGYRPLVDYGQWRVAALNYIDELLPQNLHAMQRHELTDEVFVLLAGRCILYLGQGEAAVEAIYAQDLEPFKVYNVKRGVWHTHTLNSEARLLVVENCDTSDANSPFIPLNAGQRQRLAQLRDELWGK